MHYAYRSWRRQWGKPSQRHCGGALVWQLNDTWPATSWAIVDYYLVKKPAFYAIKRDLSPLSIGVMRKHHDWTTLHPSRPDTIEYDVWVSSSRTTEVENAAIEVRFISIRTGHDYLPVQRRTARIQPNGTTTITEKDRLDYPQDRNAFVIFAKLSINGEVVSRDYDWPQPYKYLSFAEDRGLKVKLDGTRKQISISAGRPVKGLIFEERPGLTFSDNGLDIVPGEQYTVDIDGLDHGEALTWTYLGQEDAPVCRL